MLVDGNTVTLTFKINQPLLYLLFIGLQQLPVMHQLRHLC